MCPGEPPGDGMDSETHLNPSLTQYSGELGDRILGLRDGHPVAGVMITDVAEASIVASSSADVSRISPSSPAPLAAATVPYPPRMTERNERFIARHMMNERYAPDAPTSAPAMMSKSLSSRKPEAAAAQPE